MTIPLQVAPRLPSVSASFFTFLFLSVFFQFRGGTVMSTGAAYVTGFGVFLPNPPVGNDAIEDVLGHVNKLSTRLKRRILINNGIKSRYYAIDPETKRETHTNAQMTAEAVRATARDGAFPLDALDCLACGTSSADQVIPSHASMVHAEIGC